MTKAQWKKFHRQRRIFARLAEEQLTDMIIYGSSCQLVNEYGIFNIPPQEVFMKDGKTFIAGWDDLSA